MKSARRISAVSLISCCIFIFLMLIAILAGNPVYKKIKQEINASAEKFCLIIHEKTGLKISYSSLSPSILSTFYIKGIELSDDANGILLTVKQTKINYSLRQILKGNLDSAFQNIVLDGITADVSGIISLVNSLKTGESKFNLDVASIMSKIPSRVDIKNIALNYENDQLEGILILKKISLTNFRRSQNIDFSLDSSLACYIKNQKMRLSSQLGISGKIPMDFEGASLQLNVSNLTDGNWKLNKLNLLSTYSERKIKINTIQSVYPLSISVLMDMDTKDLTATVDTESLYPTTVISNIANHKQLQKIKKLCIDTNTKLNFNLNEKSINYYSKGNIVLPETLIKDGMNVSYDIKGDDKHIDVDSLNISGQSCEADVNLSFIFNTFQLSGLAELYHLKLANNNIISTELYFDPLEKGFMMFSPQLFVGEKSLTAIQFELHPEQNSFDFDFEAFDYSHEESDAGYLKIDGSYLTDSKYIQAGAGINYLYADSIAGFAQAVLPSSYSGMLNSLKENLSSFVLSGDTYFSTDFNSVSYNVPYIMVANTEEDNQALFITANGNEQSVQLNQINLIFGNYAFSALASLDIMPNSNEMFFSADLTSSSVPYHVTGSIMPEVIRISGDYQTEVEIRFENTNEMKGSVLFDNLPVVAGKNSLLISADSFFDYTILNGFQMQIARLEIEQNGNALVNVNPKFTLSGSVNKYGADFASLTYADSYSTLSGRGNVMVNITDSIFNTASINFALQNPLSEEGIRAEINLSNPEGLPVSVDLLKTSLYVDSQIDVTSFSLNRYTALRNDDNVFTGSLFATGTFEHPNVSAVIQNINLLMSGKFLNASGLITLQDRDLSVSSLDLSYAGLKVNDFTADMSLSDFHGEASAQVSANFIGQTVYFPLQIVIKDSYVPEKRILPSSFSADISISQMTGSFIHKSFGLNASLNYSDDGITVMTSDNIGLFGIYNKAGDIYGKLNSASNASFEVSGTLIKKAMDIKISDIKIDLQKIFSYINLDFFVFVDSGILDGNVSLNGTLDDPDITGELAVIHPKARIPLVVPQQIYTEKTYINIENSIIDIVENTYYMKKAEKANVWCKIYLNRWFLDKLECSIKSLPNVMHPATLKTAFFTIDGDINCDLFINLENQVCDISGKIFGDNAILKANVQSLTGNNQNKKPAGPMIYLNVDLGILLGTHSALEFDPLLRCVFVPDSRIAVKLDTEAGLYSVDGKLALRSGDIAYLNRNFYIKEGEIKFLSDELTNPLVTVRAETRERDSQGQNVRIILTAQNQKLKEFNPRFSAVPSKSEAEIQSLLGQIVVADSDNVRDFIFSAGDYAIQSMIGRNIENKLRDLLNFDIFSIRTNVLQNTLSIGTSKKLSSDKISIGNFLDNSTVYIGKYLGSALYVDAMLHLSFEDGQVTDIQSAGRLLPQPEIGLELESPFGNIRWNMAPDINALLKNQFVPSTSLTLSWKFSF